MMTMLRYFFKDGKYVLQYALRSYGCVIWQNVPYVNDAIKIVDSTLLGCSGYARKYPMENYFDGEEYMRLYVKHTGGNYFNEGDMVTCNGINFEVYSKATYHVGDLFKYVIYVVKHNDGQKGLLAAADLPVGAGIHLVDTGERLPYNPCSI